MKKGICIYVEREFMQGMIFLACSTSQATEVLDHVFDHGFKVERKTAEDWMEAFCAKKKDFIPVFIVRDQADVDAIKQDFTSENLYSPYKGYIPRLTF